MSRRISTWEKKLGNAVIGKAYQDLGEDCFATYCKAFIYEDPDAEPEKRWTLVLERAQFAEQFFYAERRIDAMMLAESEIAKQWSDYGIARLIAANPEAFRNPIDRPGAIPVTDCTKYPFWKPRKPIGPEPMPRYLANMPEEARAVALHKSFLADEQIAVLWQVDDEYK